MTSCRGIARWALWAGAALAWFGAAGCPSAGLRRVPVDPDAPVDVGPPPATGETKLRIFFADVGQGDGIVLLTQSGKAVLIDAGTKKGSASVLRVLRAQGIERLDLAIVTHPHADHMGGMVNVLGKVPAALFLDPGVDHGTAAYLKLLEFLEARAVPVKIARRGRRIDVGDGVVMEILAPEEPLLSGTRSDANSNSVVVRVTVGRFAALLVGDVEAPSENRLLADPATLAATVLKVAHHGGEQSSQARFLEAVHPEIAVISVAARNRYDHPRAETLERLRAVGAKIYRTDLHGTITLSTDGQTVQVETERVPAPREGPPVSLAPDLRHAPRGPPPERLAGAAP